MDKAVRKDIYLDRIYGRTELVNPAIKARFKRACDIKSSQLAAPSICCT